MALHGVTVNELNSQGVYRGTAGDSVSRTVRQKSK